MSAPTAYETAWASCCDATGCSDEVRAQGWQRLNETQLHRDTLADAQPSEINGQVSAVLFVVSLNTASPVSVATLVRHMKLNMKDFFFHVDDMLLRLKPGACPELKQLKEQYVIDTVFFKRWEQSFARFFPSGFVGNAGSDAEARDLKRASLELGWTLFLLAKAQTASKRTDIMSTFPLLVGVIHLLLAHLPEEAKTAGSFWQELEAEVPAECYPFPAHASAVLCGQHKLRGEELLGKREELMALEATLRRVLQLSAPTPALANGDGGGGGVAELLRPATLLATRDALSREYDRVWPQRFALDGRFFLSEQAAPRKTAGSSMPASPAPQRRAATSAAPMLTPQRQGNPLTSRATGGVPQTPISSTLESNKWLQDAVAGLQAQPSAELLEFFAACADDPTEAVRKRMADQCQRVKDHVSTLLELGGDVDELITLARKLFYKMLLAFLQAEQQRLNVNDFGKLLSNDAFHSSLLACCMEAVFAANAVDEAAFPAVLELLELHAFDFCKVIESFVKTEPRLPPHLRMHFADVEAKILESLAWADESPLHALMQEYDAAAGAAGEAGPGPSRAKAALEQFIKKVWYLAAVRIQEICTRLLLPSFLVHQVWDCLKAVLKQARQLLTGRHLDQIVMCTVYGVCKVNQRSVTFRHIIEHYKRQPKASPKVFREVRMESKADKPQDIICFYNTIYIPAMKEHLMHVVNTPTGADPAAAAGGAEGGVALPPSPSLSKLTRGGASPQRVSGRDVYVSQPRAQQAAMTPRTKTLYSFGDTPAKLQNINLQLNRTPGSDAGAMHVLHNMRSSTPQQASGPSNSEEEGGEPGSRKRSLNLMQENKGNGGGGHKMQCRLDRLGGGTQPGVRSSSQNSQDGSDYGDHSS